MMETKPFVTLPGEEPVWNMAAGRTAALKLLNEQTDGSVMAFEEAAPAGIETPLHLHHLDSIGWPDLAGTRNPRPQLQRNVVTGSDHGIANVRSVVNRRRQ
jgi:hypothetical protein